MQLVNYPIVKELVLVGGGHSHAIALKLFAMKPLLGVRLILISDVVYAPYSGMLPGHVAGFYSFEETHIDLRRLARFAGAQFYLDKAIGLDLKNNLVLCANRPPVPFDYLSLDIGSTPTKVTVPGAADYTIPAKPVPQFLEAWRRIVANAAQNPSKPLHIGIVGGGAGGVELALNVQTALTRVLQHPQCLTLHLFHRGHTLVTGQSRWVGDRLTSILKTRAVQVYLRENIVEILPNKAICESGLTVECDYIFWVTQASSAPWLQTSGLQTDSQGFVLVKDTLQSVSHPAIFAAGDVATMQNHPRPKAGVFAVRQGKPLFENLRRRLLEKPLLDFHPQKYYLSLIGTGDKSAIAAWGALGWQSPWLWRWKDRIDRQFMRGFEELKPMATRSQSMAKPQAIPEIITQDAMPCAGCGAKVGSTVLERVLRQLPQPATEAVLVGLDAPDDAAAIQVEANSLFVQTVDYFPCFINDPYIFGQITAQHTLSDLYAMGATPQTAMAIATVPYGREAKIEAVLQPLLAGAIAVLQKAQATLVGGHTTEGPELAFGLSCQGIAKGRLLRKQGMKPGDKLILTKAIGTGTLLAADMRYQAKARWVESALESMLQSNQEAALILSDFGATACTDVTGFGLLGHLFEMLKASEVAVTVDLAAIAWLDGAVETVKRGILSSLQPQNLKISSRIENLQTIQSLALYPLLFDPQTSGGLLASVPPEIAQACLQELQNAGYKHSCIIGQVRSRLDNQKPIWINLD